MLRLSIAGEERVKELYREKMTRDFPPSELKSLNAILSMMQRGEYDVFCAQQNDKDTAYALLYRPHNDCVALLDYLAVEPDQRGKGIGTAFLRLLQQHYAQETDVLLIECERPKAAPNEELARKRIHFYQKAGAQMTSVRVWLFGVEYSILVLPCKTDFVQRDWAELVLALYRKMLPPALFEQNVRLIRGHI